MLELFLIVQEERVGRRNEQQERSSKKGYDGSEMPPGECRSRGGDGGRSGRHARSKSCRGWFTSRRELLTFVDFLGGVTIGLFLGGLRTHLLPVDARRHQTRLTTAKQCLAHALGTNRTLQYLSIFAQAPFGIKVTVLAG